MGKVTRIHKLESHLNDRIISEGGFLIPQTTRLDASMLLVEIRINPPEADYYVGTCTAYSGHENESPGCAT